MRYHVPYAHRNRSPGPIYIGFDQPVSIQRRKGRFNWAGFTGLMLALLSPLTLFLAAPLALLICLFGMRRSPRGMAVVGALLALGGTTLLSLGIVGVVHHRADRHYKHQQQLVAAENRQLIRQTGDVIQEAKSELREYRTANNNYLPDLEEGMLITVQYRDAWEQELFYEPVEGGCLIRSAGPDGEFHSRDDVVTELAGVPGGVPVE